MWIQKGCTRRVTTIAAVMQPGIITAIHPVR